MNDKEWEESLKRALRSWQSNKHKGFVTPNYKGMRNANVEIVKL